MKDLLVIPEAELQTYCCEHGWTDGLPVIAPTLQSVESMLDAGGRDADETLGSIPAHGVSMDATHAAVAAVMAGCTPAYFPVVLAALAAVLDPAFNLQVVCTSTGGAALCVVVSGPVADEIGMNAHHNTMGPGARANATIGRAVRLASVNLLRTQVDRTDGTSLGHPGRYTFCLAERPATGWSSLREDLGYRASDTTVTVVPATGPIQIANHLSAEPDDVAASIAAALRIPSLFTTGKGEAQFVVALGPEHEAAFRDAGWSRSDVRARLARVSAVHLDALADAGVVIEEGTHHDMVPDSAGFLPTVGSEADVHLVCTWGAGAGWSSVIPSWAPKKHAQVVSRRVRGRDELVPDCGPDACDIELTAVEPVDG